MTVTTRPSSESKTRVRKPGRQALIDLLVITSLVNLSLVRVWRELLFLSPADQYWANPVTSRALLAVLLNLTWISLMLWVGSLFVRRGGSRLESLGRLIFVALLAVPLNLLRSLLGLGSEALYWLVAKPWLASFIVVTSVVMAGYLVLRQLTFLTRVAAILALLLSPFALMTTGQAGSALFRLSATTVQEHAPTQGRLPSISVQASASQRVVWVMFDEFDLRLGFSERPESVRLPNLDRLRSESLFAAATDAHRKNTTEAIPSYLTGRLVDSAVPASSDQLGLRFAGESEGGLRSWAEHPTFFSRARDRGARVGVVGIYHPYCRLFEGLLASCDQFTLSTYSPHSRDSLAAEMWSQLRALSPLANRLNGIDMYQGVLDKSLELVADPGLDVVYVHASVPHGPEIFDLESQTFTPFLRDPMAYFGNLVLADRFFGELRTRMEQEGLWESTTVLVTSDHEWRRSANYDGKRTSGVPFMLKLAGQRQPFEYAHRFSPMLVASELLLEIQRGQLTTMAQVVDWLDRRIDET